MARADSDVVHLASGDAAAAIALRGAEPVRWTVSGHELLWGGDPAHWSYSAPILFPLVGASRGGAIEVDGRRHPMPQHGFARTSLFVAVETAPDSVRLRLEADGETLAQYPFPFRLDVLAALAPATLTLRFEVTNTGGRPMPYGLGFHPAFPWPLPGAPDRAGHRVVFAAQESDRVPEVAEGGLLARSTRPIPLDGTTLPLAPDLFTEALVFLNARSRSFRFEAPRGAAPRGAAPGGAAIEIKMEDFPHLAVWSRPTAPFLSLEAWTAHADWADAAGDLFARPALRHLPPGAVGRHAVRLTFRPPPA